MKLRVAKAFWTLKNVTAAEGRAQYGQDFANYDDMLMAHACAYLDPRCDQGHLGMRAHVCVSLRAGEEGGPLVYTRLVERHL